MSATGTAIAPAPNANPALIEQKLRLQSRMRSGASWLMAVAIFSVINSGLVMFNAKLHFIVGLGVTQIADLMARHGGASGSTAGVIVSLFMAGAFAVFWKFARAGQQWAFLVGMVMYALDGLIFLAAGAMLDLGFHAFALYCMFHGLKALNTLSKMNLQNTNCAGSPSMAH